MTTPLRTMDYAEVVQKTKHDIMRERIPFAVMVELTHRCNLRCVHCYCPPTAPAKGELTLAEWETIFDKLAEAGTIQVALTGGDPLLRRDFSEIYLAAKKRGFLVIVFTNATLITDPILELFSTHRPRRLEVSLYGRSEAVYTAVTQVQGAHRHCYEIVRRLVERGIPLELKTVAMTLTKDEVYEMKAFAAEIGVPFHFDGRIHPRIDGSFKPLRYRLPPKELAELEASSPEGLHALAENYEFAPRYDKGNESVFQCGAGLLTATVDPYGRLHLCIVLRKPGFDLLHGDFQDVWQGPVRALRDVKRAPGGMTRPNQNAWAERCPGLSYLEHGEFDRQSEYIREVSEAEQEAVRRRTRGQRIAT
ncbi:MAG: radical SAM protein [Planctomycetes bacterium]|nr:radical SAM protein [Planctomycetota bacterium]